MVVGAAWVKPSRSEQLAGRLMTSHLLERRLVRHEIVANTHRIPTGEIIHRGRYRAVEIESGGHVETRHDVDHDRRRTSGGQRCMKRVRVHC